MPLRTLPSGTGLHSRPARGATGRGMGVESTMRNLLKLVGRLAYDPSAEGPRDPGRDRPTAASGVAPAAPTGPAVVQRGGRAAAGRWGRCSGRKLPSAGGNHRRGRPAGGAYARLGCDSPELGAEPEPGDRDHDAEKDKGRSVDHQVPGDPPLALVQEVAAEFVDLPLQVQPRGTDVPAECRGFRDQGQVGGAAAARAASRRAVGTAPTNGERPRLSPQRAALAWGSMSTRAAEPPAPSKSAATWTARVVLPVPPFWANSAIVYIASAALPSLSRIRPPG